LRKDFQERGNQFALTQLRAMVAYVVHLTMDEPDRARREVTEAMEGWPVRGFQIPHYWQLTAMGEIDLYLGDGLAAWTRSQEAWPVFNRSMLNQVQKIRINVTFLRARSALAAAESGGDRRTLLRHAARDARRIARERMPWSDPLSSLIRAGIAVAREEIAQAAALLEAAVKGFDAADMALHAAAARRRQGELIGGAAGTRLIDRADDWMEGQGARDPVRMTRMIAPGFASTPRGR
jgi:hypothetical protein